MSPLIAESGRMADGTFRTSEGAEAQVCGGGPSLHEAQLQSAGHAKRRRRADALNEHFGAHSVAEGMAAFRSRLPESFRKDAVQAVEYLITASPSAMQGKPKSEQDAYFRDSLEWLKQRHGAENVVYAGIHRDETTPHMYAYVVPRDPNQAV